MTVDDEKNIIRQVVNGDKDTFEALVLANQKNVYNLALKMMRNPDDALDISQEAFLKAYRQLAGFRGDCRFSVWLYRLTYNLCIDVLRKNKDKQTVSLDFDEAQGEAKPLEIPDLRHLPEDSILRKELRKSIADGINELPQQHREILVLREITGMSYEDISATLKINLGTVKSRLSRAKLALVEILERKGTFSGDYRQNN